MHFPTPAVSRLAAVTAGLALLTIAAGAVLASDFTIQSAALSPALPGRIHEYLALLVSVLAVVLLLQLLPTNTADWLRGMAWGGVAVVAAEGALALLQVITPLPMWQSLTHAILAPLTVAFLTALACFTLPEWQMDPEPVNLSPWPIVPVAAKVAPLLVLLQIAMGAAYRHKAWSVMPHMAGAMLVAAVLLVVPVMLLQQFPKHPSLRPVAIAAMSAALLQITLGITAFVMRLLDFDTSTAFIAVAASHVCVGAITLAASLVLAIEVARCTAET
jgi:heme A synthase